MNYLIRKAISSDAKGVVEVNTYTWMSTYKGLIPDEILDYRLKTMDDRVLKTECSIKEKNNIYVAVADNKIVGIMSYGKSRNEEYYDCGEIYSIYVLKNYQGLGIGKSLFMTGINELIKKGYNKMILNVLNGNSTIEFYKKYMGRKVGEKQDNFGDTVLTESIMYFENLIDIYSSFNGGRLI